MDIWKKHRLNFAARYCFSSASEIELFFKSKYPSTFPVLFPSARSAINSILKYKKCSRGDKVWLAPYTGHCLLNTVSITSTPSDDLYNSKLVIINHQFGYENLYTNLTPDIIEDSVDSIVEDESALFPNNGEFEVFSLPKIFGSMYGGILLSKNKESYNFFINERNDSTFGFFHNLRKLTVRLSKKNLYYWSFCEPLNKSIPAIGISDILNKLNNWDELIKTRKKNIEILMQLDLPFIEFHLSKRLPTALLLTSFNKSDEITLGLTPRFFTNGAAGRDQYYPIVLPIPIHSKISNSLIENLKMYKKGF